MKTTALIAGMALLGTVSILGGCAKKESKSQTTAPEIVDSIGVCPCCEAELAEMSVTDTLIGEDDSR